MLGGIFIYGGLDALRHPESKAPAADTLVADAVELTDSGPFDLDSKQLVRAGAALALGIVPRVAAMALIASLIPTTAAGHRFWEEQDASSRAQQTVQFLKNLAIAGGLVFAAIEHGGRPSMPWRARHAVSGAAQHALEVLPGSHG